MSTTLDNAPTFEEIDQCSTINWHPLFSNESLPIECIELQEPILNYLKSDEMRIPTDLELDNNQMINNRSQLSDSEEDLSEELQKDFNSNNFIKDEENRLDSEEEEEEEEQIYDISFLKQFKDIVQPLIVKLGGKVFIKLNWSAPKDAYWITPTNTLQCDNFYDVLLLLKSSDIIDYDLTQVYNQCLIQPNLNLQKKYLILKPFIKVDPSLEFRCFVLGKQLIGISQRDINYYNFLTLKEERNFYLKQIQTFFKKVILPRFPLEHYTFDIYYDSWQAKFILIDFNPALQTTDPILFTWLELKQMYNDQIQISKDKEANQVPSLIEFRFIESEAEAQSLRSERALSNRFPIEMSLVPDEVQKILT